MEDISKQEEEVETLKAIYGDQWRTENEENRSYSIKIQDGKYNVTLYIKMPPDYPSMAPPCYEISAPHLGKNTKIEIGRSLDEVYLSCIGQTVIFQWIEEIREKLQQLNNTSEPAEEEKVETESSTSTNTEEIDKCPEITHGEIISDRKSTFQGHVAKVTSEAQIKSVLRTLMENKKIANATHNMYAYRMIKENTSTSICDFEDDGEAQAGGRLLHFLEKIDATNVLVVVTRWYGGIHLGFDRFRHINKAAKLALVAANLMPESKMSNKRCC